MGGLVQSDGKERIASPDAEFRGIPAALTRTGVGVRFDQMILTEFATSDRATGFNAVDAQVNARAMYLPRPATITGFTLYMSTLPTSITLDQTNQAGIYTSDGTTLTLAASTAANDFNLNMFRMTTANNSTGWHSIFLSTPYNAAAGLYWVALVHNWSAIGGTRAVIGTTQAVGAGVMVPPGLTNVKTYWSLAAQTALPASQAWSGTTAASSAPAIYPIGEWT